MTPRKPEASWLRWDVGLELDTQRALRPRDHLHRRAGRFPPFPHKNLLAREVLDYVLVAALDKNPSRSVRLAEEHVQGTQLAREVFGYVLVAALDRDPRRSLRLAREHVQRTFLAREVLDYVLVAEIGKDPGLSL